jgi:hypothetical protein
VTRGRKLAVALGAVLAVLVGRSLLEGRASIRRAYEHDTRGEVDAAIGNAMRATKWYVPFAPHPREGYDLMRTIARRAEAAGDVETALIAWQAIRGGARATRSLYVPYEDRLREADAQIATLLAARPPAGIDRDKPREHLVQEYRALLAREDGPRPSAVVALYAGLAMFVFGAYRALEDSSMSPSDREPARRRTYASLAVAVVGLIAFAIAVSRA